MNKIIALLILLLFFIVSTVVLNVIQSRQIDNLEINQKHLLLHMRKVNGLEPSDYINVHTLR